MKKGYYIGLVGGVVVGGVVWLSCGGGGDFYFDLGDGYTLGHEGVNCTYITGDVPPDGVVPPNVVEYDFDGDFIVAKQVPSGERGRLWRSDVRYGYGLDSTYYWLVVKENGVVKGPMLYGEFVEMRERYGVSKELRL